MIGTNKTNTKKKKPPPGLRPEPISERTLRGLARPVRLLVWTRYALS